MLRSAEGTAGREAEERRQGLTCGQREGTDQGLAGALGPRSRVSQEACPGLSPGSGILALIAPMTPREPQVSPGFGSCSLLILNVGLVVKGAAVEAVLVSTALEAPRNAWKFDRNVCKGPHAMNQRHAERRSNPGVLFIPGLWLSTALCSRSRLT